MLYTLHDSHVRPSMRVRHRSAGPKYSESPCPPLAYVWCWTTRVPEERRRHQIARVAGVAEALRRAHEFGDLTVAVLAVEVVLAAFERIGERVMLELEREGEPAPVPGVGPQIGEDFVHAALLGVEHLRELGRAERRQDALGPGSESGFDLERRGVARVPVGVAQTGERLVQCVPGRPEPVEIERLRADDAVVQFAERLASVLERAQVAVAVLVLHFLEAGHEIVGALLEPIVARGLVHEAHRGEMVARDVSGEIAAVAVPSRVAGCFGRQARTDPVVRQHPVGIEREQVLHVLLLRVLQWSTREPHVGQRHGTGADHLLRNDTVGERGVPFVRGEGISHRASGTQPEAQGCGGRGRKGEEIAS